MKVVIIGAGNVATHMAKALFAAKLQITSIWSYHYQNAITLANQVNATAVEHLAEIDLTADLCLVAVKDDAISEIIAQLSGFKGIVAHTSGAVDLTVFKDLITNYGVFYPLQTFSKTRAIDFGIVPICLEANNNQTLATLRELAEKLSKNVEEVGSEKRKILHLAAVFACNFTNYLYVVAEEILEKHDLSFELIRPLIEETAAKIQYDLPGNVQTGPAIRNDEQTLSKHHALLAQQPHLLELYKTLSERIKKTRS